MSEKECQALKWLKGRLSRMFGDCDNVAYDSTVLVDLIKSYCFEFHIRAGGGKHE